MELQQHCCCGKFFKYKKLKRNLISRAAVSRSRASQRLRTAVQESVHDSSQHTDRNVSCGGSATSRKSPAPCEWKVRTARKPALKVETISRLLRDAYLGKTALHLFPTTKLSEIPMSDIYLRRYFTLCFRTQQMV